MKITPIVQKHKFGCGVACIAMVTGKPYDTIEVQFERDFNVHGLSVDEMVGYLGDNGFSIVFSQLVNYGHRSLGRSILTKPIAPVHIIRTQPQFDSEHGHFVVMDEQGKIICPQGLDEDQILRHYIFSHSIALFDLDYMKKFK